MQNLERRMQKIVARELRRYSEKCRESRQEESTEMVNASIRRQEKIIEDTEELMLLLEKHNKEHDKLLHEFDEWSKNASIENALYLAKMRKEFDEEMEAFRNEFPDLFSQ